MKLYILAICLIATSALCAQETNETIQKWLGSRPDGHAPISIMGDHMHGKGEWMFAYRYMNMNMEELATNGDDLSSSDALTSYMMIPQKMQMNMHMVGVMFAPSNKITLTAGISHSAKEMEMLNAMGAKPTTNSEGFGDVKISALYKFFNKNRQQLHTQFKVSIPTGSITQRDDTPMMQNAELPYGMQIGSGTFDTSLGLTYLGQTLNTSWGSQLNGTLRHGENSEGYRLGNMLQLNNWFAVKASEWISLSARVTGSMNGKINGSNPDLNSMMIAANTNNSGWERIGSGLGLNFYVPKGSLKNLRFGFEYNFPLYQNGNGVQLKKKDGITLGTQYAF